MSKETGKKLAVAGIFLACALGFYKTTNMKSDPLNQVLQKIDQRITVPVRITDPLLLFLTLWIGTHNKWTYPKITKQFNKVRYSKTGRKFLAIHEMGHALAVIKSNVPAKISKVSLEPNLASSRSIGGLMQGGDAFVKLDYLFRDEKNLSRENIESLIVFDLAGIEAVNVLKNTPLKWRYGGFNDYSWARKEAGNLIDRFEKTANPLERRKKINHVYAELKKRAYDLMASNKGLLEFTAEKLLEKGTLSGEEVLALVKEYESVHTPEVS